ncbi:UDP-3-O-(3-hydroxymyristoyl)glucosamine N-acyltransferase [Candidatus Sumerlaeota bacterium]|nr:UDP-3-O-(3-hydroxymyristoyl)glucosamine N-acyltransferase [Candidatus Sumerlaeota bacterium]
MRRKAERQIGIQELAERLGARLVGRLVGSAGDAVLSDLATLPEAGPDDLSFVSDPKHLDAARESRAGALLVPEGVEIAGRPCLVVGNVWKTLLTAFDLWYPDEPAPEGVHPTAVVDPAAELGAGVSVGPMSVIEAGVKIGAGTQVGAQCFIGRDARIGEGCLLYPGVRIMERIQVGRGVILHSGVVLGADGFKYEVIDAMPVKIPQVGTVVIEDGVEIGANTTIDRAFLNETRIGMMTKIDNLVHVAHNCRIGRMNGIAGQVGFAGSIQTGDGCILWGQVGIRDQAKIGNRVTILAQSGVKDDIPDGETWFGAPAMPVKEAARIVAAQRRLPELMKRVKELEKKAGTE